LSGSLIGAKNGVSIFLRNLSIYIYIYQNARRHVTEYGITKEFLSLIRCMCYHFKCKILHEGKLTDYIEITHGVRQDCILSPIIFLLILDNVMRKTLGNSKRE
jgi:hypothetical protein